ncbi:MAG TPA: SpoIIE family protein phosphatase [Bacteroidota bacterium]|nr:SpoIIE family protein phosphatase [Bacteroidota bacterium]
MKLSLKNASPRTIRITFTVLAILTTAIAAAHLMDPLVFNVTTNDECLWVKTEDGRNGIVIHEIIQGGVTDRAGVRDGDSLLAINGKPVTFLTAQGTLNRYNYGDTVTYALARGSAHLEARIEVLKLFDILDVSLFFLGFGFLTVGYIVVMTKPEGSIQRMFGIYGILALLLFGVFNPGLAVGNVSAWRAIAILIGFFAGRVIAPPYMVRFFLHFPVRNALARNRWISALLYIISTGSLVLLVLSGRFNFSQGTSLALLGTPIIFFLGGLGIFIFTYATGIDPATRRQLRPILLGVAIGIGVFAYMFLLIFLYSVAFFFLKPLLMLPIVLLILTPVSFGYAIFRYRLMDIDLIVERSLLYGAITASLAGVYVALVFGLGSLLGMIVPELNSRLVSVAAFIVIAFIFDPVKQRVQNSIDRTFYRERHDYQKALLEFSQELPRFIDVHQIMESIVARISSTMHVDTLAVVVYLPDGTTAFTGRNLTKEECSFSPSDDGLRSYLTRTGHPQSLAFIREETTITDEDDRRLIAASGVVSAVPMILQERLLGIILVGPKRSGKVYSKEDHNLLATVAVQAAIAIENARLQESELEKQKIQKELDLARRIQEGLLPKADPALPPLDVAGITIPALTVGGDYYDYIRPAPGKLLTVVADVSGKGMSAALYMSKIQGMIQLAAGMYQSPKEMLIHVNRLLYGGIERSSFITMILLLWDLEQRTARICRAGHNKAIIAAGGKPPALLNTAGIGLGLERGPLFDQTLEEISIPFDRQSLVILYSDGLPETMDSSGALLGEEAILGIACDRAGRSSRQILDSLLAAADGFRGNAEQHDDITIVVHQVGG